MQYFGFDRPSFGIKTFGFGESSPKLSADFTTGTYNSNGAAKTFADLFNFTRAGKAWLVKETGLQEYTADVPRLDNGLLIEQSTTNTLTYSLLQGTDAENYSSRNLVAATNDDILKTGKMYTYNKTGSTVWAYKNFLEPFKNIDIYASRTDGLSVRFGKSGLTEYDGHFNVENIGDIKHTYNAVTGLTLASAVTTGSLVRGGITRYAAQEKENADLRTHAMQATADDYSSSLIVTTTVPVTRPADYLLNKITGTTVTGDWDSTLTLSIVAGNLVHSGYGRIRSLEIN